MLTHRKNISFIHRLKHDFIFSDYGILRITAPARLFQVCTFRASYQNMQQLSGMAH
jgi:hypothetical protein